MTISEINTEIDATESLVKAGNYSAALDRALCVQLGLAGMPDIEKGGRGGETMKWPLDRIDKFILNLRQRITSSVGLQRTKVTYARATE